ncbi:MAG TPA: FAD-binding oxidoreductase [Dehalococcoidia bacterium]|nr:FAD-binding oxidoreductase [Dehalococcoidia bacterium]
MRQTADAVVIGGGVMGCSIQYHLARLGITSSLLLEQDVLGSGSTGRSQTICRTHYSNPITTTLAWESLRIFTNFSEIIGGDAGFVKTGYLVVVGPDDQAGLRRNVAMQQDLGVSTALVTADDLLDLAPMIQVSDGEGMAWEPESGYADSHQVTTSFAARAREMGAEVAMRTIASGVEVSGGRVRAVLTSQGRVETPIAVVAAGPWSKQVLSGIGIDVPLSTVRHQVASIVRPVEPIPHHPIVGDIAQSFSFRPEGSAMTLVGFGEDEADLAGYNQGVDLDRVPEVMERLVNRMPAMSESYFRGGWSGLFTVTPDWHPILDRVPGVDGLYCAVGFSGHGFKLSPAIGLAMAELITQGRAISVDLTPLRFSRFEEGDRLTSSYHYNVLA